MQIRGTESAAFQQQDAGSNPEPQPPLTYSVIMYSCESVYETAIGAIASTYYLFFTV